MSLIPCRDCGQPQSTSADVCLNCGSLWQQHQNVLRAALICAVLVALFTLLFLWRVGALR